MCAASVVYICDADFEKILLHIDNLATTVPALNIEFPGLVGAFFGAVGTGSMFSVDQYLVLLR